MTLDVETQARLPLVAGGLSVALGRTIKVIYPERKHAATEEWERAFQIFGLLLKQAEARRVVACPSRVTPPRG